MAANVSVPPFTEAPSTVVGSTPQSVFAFDFPFWSSADVLVYVDDVLLASSAYSVEGFYIQGDPPAAVEGGYGSGRITLDAPVSSCTVTIDRMVVGDRRTQFGRTSPLAMPALNGDLNRVTARQQDLLRYMLAQRAYLDAAIEEAGSAIGLVGKADKDGGNVTDEVAFRENILAAAQAVVGVNMADVGTPNDITADNTAAFNAALLVTSDVQFTQDNYYGNFVLDESARGIRGRMGEGETGDGGINCLRPFDVSLPTLRIGGGEAPVFNATVRDIVISGFKATGQSAPSALKFAGGVAHASLINFELIGGDVSLDIEPSGGAVTCNSFSHFHIRAHGTGIRCYRPADDEGYFTHNPMTHGHVNGSATGYGLEIITDDGPGIVPTFSHVYFDVQPGFGVNCVGSSFFYGFDVILDPGTIGAVILKSDQLTLDPTRYFGGLIRHGGQVIENSLGATQAIPGDCDWFFFKQCATDMFFKGIMYWAGTGDRFDTTKYVELFTATSLGITGLDLTVRNTTQATGLGANQAAIQTEGGIAAKGHGRFGGDVFVYGGNAVAAGSISSGTSGGGLFIEAFSSDVNAQDIQLLPTVNGFVRLRQGSGIRPHDDAVQTVGRVGNAFANSFSAAYSGAGGDALINSSRHFVLRSYTVSTLPSAAAARELIYVADETGGAIPAFSDGTNWRRVTDRAVVA